MRIGDAQHRVNYSYARLQMATGSAANHVHFTTGSFAEQNVSALGAQSTARSAHQLLSRFWAADKIL